ncbi:rab11 family-interacting protein 3 isoform X2 [Polypterus senegalus]|uniref:rab11 family-interacting protein 3 isoform X2 n=1 Tax=Polypterus senegalus TaxID=55291 RepID=UPI0019655B0C|nr:rab11 family-interacting protein 3 isoform X2 [Polypterus senegalus]
MEQMLLSSPTGRSDWDLDKKMGELGFILLEADKGPGLPPVRGERTKAALDFMSGDKELVSLNLGGFFRSSRYPTVNELLAWDNGLDYPVLQWEGKASPDDPQGPAVLVLQDGDIGGHGAPASAELDARSALSPDPPLREESHGAASPETVGRVSLPLDDIMPGSRGQEGSAQGPEDQDLPPSSPLEGEPCQSSGGAAAWADFEPTAQTTTSLSRRASPSSLERGASPGSNVAMEDLASERESWDGAPRDVLDWLGDADRLDQRTLHVPVGEEWALPPEESRLGAAGGAEVDELSALRAVFDMLDQDKDGFVRTEEFVQFATVYGAEQVKDLTRFLDPTGLGVISFEDFFRGIAAINNGGADGQPFETRVYGGAVESASCPEEFEDFTALENEVTDSAYLGSESTYSECETFTDEDTGTLVHQELHEEVETDSAIDAALHYGDDSASGSHCHRLSLDSELNSHSLVTVIGQEEEHFEDFGEGIETELLPDGPASSEDDASVNSPLESTALHSPSADSFPSGLHDFLREELLDFFCSQCHKQINRLEDLSARLNYLEMNSASKRLSSKKVARHLRQTSAFCADSMEDVSRDIADFAETDIADKVVLLEKRLMELEKDATASGEQHTRLRHENLQVVHRANALEEQLKEQEMRAEEALLLEIRRHKEALCKVERERGIEIENLQARLQQLDEENSELRSCLPCLRANIERLEEEKRKLQDLMEDTTIHLNEELESRRKLSDKLAFDRHKNQKEKESTQELIEDLRKQLEHLQLYKLEAEARRGRSASAGLQEYNSRTREAELEQEVRRLKQDNRNLKEQNDELNGQIINLSIQGAKNLFAASFSESLAAEISSVSRDELMEAIHKQKEINYRLQDYIDRIIVAIMESNPSILEVK